MFPVVRITSTHRKTRAPGASVRPGSRSSAPLRLWVQVARCGVCTGGGGSGGPELCQPRLRDPKFLKFRPP